MQLKGTMDLGAAFVQDGGVLAPGNSPGLATVVGIVLINEGQRRIPVHYSRSIMRGGRMMRQAGSSFIPLRVNSAGMIPLIFALSIMAFPAILAGFFTAAQTQWVHDLALGTVAFFQNPSTAAGSLGS